MPKLRYFAEASVFFPKLYQKKLENCTNNTAKVSKMVKKYAFASVTSPPKLLLQKLLPNSSAEALAGARFGRSLKEMHHLVYIPFCVCVPFQASKLLEPFYRESLAVFYDVCWLLYGCLTHSTLA